MKSKIHAYELENSITELISIFEIELAKELKPVIGNH
jgi:hypothetical protein